ncbi:MAG TPA: flagellin, partial [Acidothermaceae bacterium]|nr:flagellin [Acidothermaceae bacterium]
LSQAVKNAQDGINVVQTADGALTEVDSILQRMNVLTVQANNSGSQDSGAVAAAQAEFDQLAGEIDNISKTTKFGQSNLLDGTFGGTSATVATAMTGIAADTGATGFAGTDFSNMQIDFNGLTIDGTTLAASTLTAKLTGHSTNDYGTAEASGHYSRAEDVQKDLQKSVDTALKTAVSGYTAGDVKVSVNDEGNGVWKVALSSSVAGTTLSAKGATAGDFGFSTTATTATAAANGGVFQIGADNGDTQIVKISNADSSTLGVAAGTDVSQASTITAVQGAIAKVSTLRSTLGAYQNGFQHTINNLNVTVENLQSSNSAIQDTDMASEMVNFTKAQVLQQAGVSMLAQANSASQAVLKLLG